VKLIPHTRGGALWRFALAALIVIGFTAATTAVAGLLQFKQIAAELSLSPPIKSNQVTIADPGNPQTLLLIGSDHRIGEPFSASNTDTMMLVRLDPNSSTINVLSVPRDLKVQIPEHGGIFTDKINAAYSLGGPDLLLKIIRQQVFPGIHVNHIIDVNFGGFEALVNAIGCVYVDVDHRYYNNTAFTDYSSIDIQPGYQKLCGPAALAFVRFRHTDTDLVRNARQQDFLRWVKSQYSVGQIISNRDTLLRIFGQHTQTDHDLHTTDGLINLFNLVAFSAGHAVKQIPFPAILLPCGPGTTAPGGVTQTPCYVSADPGAEQRAFGQFMTPTVVKPASVGSAPKPSGPSHPGGHGGGGGGLAAGLVLDSADGDAQVAAMPHANMPVAVPKAIVGISHFCTNATCTIGPVADSYPRTYALRGSAGGWHAAYRITLALNPVLGQYYGIQGTTWLSPPILSSPTETRTIGGKKLMLFYNGHKLTLVAWRTPQAVYWLSNTLTDDITNAQMLGIASSLHIVK
jgi:LCP family protein required for cell wall assembly